MSKFNDYINSLEGKTDLVVVDVVAELNKLHAEESESAVAKVGELDTTIAAKDQEIADAKAEISKQKALNFDLSVQLTANANNNPSGKLSEITGSNITPDDLFESK